MFVKKMAESNCFNYIFLDGLKAWFWNWLCTPCSKTQFVTRKKILSAKRTVNVKLFKKKNGCCAYTFGKCSCASYERSFEETSEVPREVEFSSCCHLIDCRAKEPEGNRGENLEMQDQNVIQRQPRLTRETVGLPNVDTSSDPIASSSKIKAPKIGTKVELTPVEEFSSTLDKSTNTESGKSKAFVFNG